MYLEESVEEVKFYLNPLDVSLGLRIKNDIKIVAENNIDLI